MPGRFPQCATMPALWRDLSRLMALTVRAWRLRLDAAEALHREDYASAAELARAAERMAHTSRGAALSALAEWLAASHSGAIATPFQTYPLQ